MITESEIYWITRLNGLITVLAIIGSMLIVAGIVLIISWYADWYHNEDRAIFRKRVKRPVLPIIIGMLMIFSIAFVPTTRQMCIIKILPLIANNEQVQELPNKIVELANDWLDELKPNRGQNKN